MSWLYTLVFAGLVFSSNDSTVPVTECNFEQPSVVTANAYADETERFEQTYQLSPNGRVSVSNVNGSITVEGWDRSEVKLVYVKTADSKERLADVDIRIDAKPDHFSVETDYGDWRRDRNGDRWKNHGKLTVDYQLMVPRGAVLNEIETVNGSATVSNFTNLIKVSAVNGSVIATNLRGTAKLSTVNGEVKADFDRLETGSKIALETVNGSVNLVIPSDANATVRADSLNGTISNDFGLPVRKGKYVGRDLYGRLGTGEIQIKLESVNGGLSIGHKSDGKSVSPAVNLLPQKEKDDDDWDNDDEDSMIRSAKINKEIAKSVKENSKTAAKAMADAKVQLSNLEPEIARIRVESVENAAKAMQLSAEMMKSDKFKQAIKDAQLKQFDVAAKIAEASFFPTVPRVERKSESFPVKGTPNVSINARGCSVGVRGWDKSEVQYRVTQLSSPHNREPLQITEDHSDSAVNIRVQNPDSGASNSNFFPGSSLVRIEVFVPRKVESQNRRQW